MLWLGRGVSFSLPCHMCVSVLFFDAGLVFRYTAGLLPAIARPWLVEALAYHHEGLLGLRLVSVKVQFQEPVLLFETWL